MDLSNTPKEPKEKKIPSLSKKKDIDLSQLNVLYALDKGKQSTLSPLSNMMAPSISVNSFKHDERFKKRVVRVLPQQSTNNSIVLIDPAVDLVDSPCNDQSKLPKKRVNDQPTLSKKKESSNFGENSNDVNIVADQKTIRIVCQRKL